MAARAMNPTARLRAEPGAALTPSDAHFETANFPLPRLVLAQRIRWLKIVCAVRPLAGVDEGRQRMLALLLVANPFGKVVLRVLEHDAGRSDARQAEVGAGRPRVRMRHIEHAVRPLDNPRVSSNATIAPLLTVRLIPRMAPPAGGVQCSSTRGLPAAVCQSPASHAEITDMSRRALHRVPKRRQQRKRDQEPKHDALGDRTATGFVFVFGFGFVSWCPTETRTRIRIRTRRRTGFLERPTLAQPRGGLTRLVPSSLEMPHELSPLDASDAGLS